MRNSDSPDNLRLKINLSEDTRGAALEDRIAERTAITLKLVEDEKKEEPGAIRPDNL